MAQNFDNILAERLESAFQTLRSAGSVHTRGDFAEAIGVNRSSLSRAFSGDPRYLTESLVRKAEGVLAARAAYTFKPAEDKDGEPDTLPVLPMGARAGTIQDWCDAAHEYDCEKIVSPIRGASLAAQVTGDSMSPEYPSGSQVIVKRIDEAAFVQWGEVYLLDTVNGPVLKRVRRTDRDDAIECVSLNPAYQPFRVECKDIRGWYRVLMCLALK